MDAASARAFDTMVRAAGVVVRNGLAHPSFSQGTLEQRLACTPDVLRLCSEFIPDADQITICLREKSAELSDACRTVFEAAMNQPPNASDSTHQARKRATK
jgi:hypothetical protein